MLSKLKGRVGLVAGACLVAIAGFALYSTVLRGDAGSELTEDVNNPVYIDELGNTFRISARLGETNIISPKSGKPGYPAEYCWWTKDGKPKEEPTPVLVSSYLGKDDPTFCPDCGRLVVPHNPKAMEGMTPPPTRENYRPR